MTEANRWLLYAALLSVLVLLLRRDERLGWLLIGSATAAVVGVACWMVLKMAFGDGGSLFLATRLNEPLGYVNGEAGYLLLGFWPLVALAEASGRRPLAGALGAGGAVVIAALLLLTQSR